jgi:hypothetical protein
MSKKIIILGSIVLGIILIILAAYVLLGKSSTGSGTTASGFKGFFPFGGGSSTSGTPTPAGQPVQQPAGSGQVNFAQKLRKLSSEPVAGAGTFDAKSGTTVRYMEKATGHIYDVELFSPNQTRISNTTIPTAYSATWTNGAKNAVSQYLKDDNQTIDTYSIALKDNATSTEKTLSAVQFPTDITGFDTSGNSIFYLLATDSGSIGIVSDLTGGKKKQIWNSPLRELLPQYVNAGTVALTTKPEQGLPGYLYFINTATGGVKRVMGDVSQLSTLANPDATLVAASGENGSSLSMALYKVSDGSQSAMTPATFPEKCVWSKKDKNVLYCAVPTDTLRSDSLISWYKGMTFFSDQLWKYDLKSHTAAVVESFSSDTSEPIDIIKPILSDSEQYLVFVNKRDGSLWSLDLTK